MREVFHKKSFVSLWLTWHFFSVPKEIMKGWKNILVFNLNFFSISFLIKTFFSYWHKYRWYYDKIFSFKNRINVLFSNFVSRFLGALIRFFLIIIGLLIELLIVLIGFFILIFWFFLPILSVMGVVLGIFIIKNGGSI